MWLFGHLVVAAAQLETGASVLELNEFCLIILFLLFIFVAILLLIIVFLVILIIVIFHIIVILLVLGVFFKTLADEFIQESVKIVTGIIQH